MELNVTQAAISHQVKALEQYLHCRLFIRLTRQLQLTHDGQSLYAVLNESFDRIETVSEKIRRGTRNEAINISLTPHFSAKWLTIRLSGFWQNHPEIDLRLHHSSQPWNYDQNEIDLSISWGLSDHEALSASPLLTSRVVPVCSPDLISQEKPLKRLQDLKHHTLLHENDYSLWELWLCKVGVPDIDANRGSTMDDANVIYQAALDGQGIALGAEKLLADDMASGRLIMPFDKSLSFQYAYYISYKPGALDKPRIKAFYQWLLAESKK